MATVTALHPSQAQSPASIPVNQEPHEALPQAGSTSHPDPVPRGPVNATLNFFKAPGDGSKPYNFVEKPPEGVAQRNFPDEYAEINIHDARGCEQEFWLDNAAWQPLQGYPHNPEIDWADEESIKRVYYPEVERILKERTGGDRVLLFDHTIRSPTGNRQAVNRAHIDQTPKSSQMRVEYHLPDEAEKLLQGRYRIINVWRPLNGPVESNPLAFADARSVPEGDTVGIEHRYPHRTGETAGVKHNPAHQWYYWSGMKNDERIMLQCFDSKYPLKRVPHSAFNDPRNTPESKPRESIEVRALVFGG